MQQLLLSLSISIIRFCVPLTDLQLCCQSQMVVVVVGCCLPLAHICRIIHDVAAVAASILSYPILPHPPPLLATHSIVIANVNKLFMRHINCLLRGYCMVFVYVCPSLWFLCEYFVTLN